MACNGSIPSVRLHARKIHDHNGFFLTIPISNRIPRVAIKLNSVPWHQGQQGAEVRPTAGLRVWSAAANSSRRARQERYRSRETRPETNKGVLLLLC